MVRRIKSVFWSMHRYPGQPESRRSASVAAAGRRAACRSRLHVVDGIAISLLTRFDRRAQRVFLATNALASFLVEIRRCPLNVISSLPDVIGPFLRARLQVVGTLASLFGDQLTGLFACPRGPKNTGRYPDPESQQKVAETASFLHIISLSFSKLQAFQPHLTSCRAWYSSKRFSKMAPRAKPKKLDENALWNYALRVLGQRAHSAGELKQKLAHRAQSPRVLSSTLGKLREYGFTDDAKFSEAFAAVRLQNRGFGRYRVLRDLRSRRVAGALAEQAVEKAFSGTDESDLIRQF